MAADALPASTGAGAVDDDIQLREGEGRWVMVRRRCRGAREEREGVSVSAWKHGRQWEDEGKCG